MLVDRGLAASRERAQALILAGKVLVDEQKIEKAGVQIDEASAIRLLGEDLKYVSRGGWKLEAALLEFQVAVRDKVCMDVGTSTGGFTDCLLQSGALRVHAVDTGAGQIDHADPAGLATRMWALLPEDLPIVCSSTAPRE